MSSTHGLRQSIEVTSTQTYKADHSSSRRGGNLYLAVFGNRCQLRTIRRYIQLRDRGTECGGGEESEFELSDRDAIIIITLAQSCTVSVVAQHICIQVRISSSHTDSWHRPHLGKRWISASQQQEG